MASGTTVQNAVQNVFTVDLEEWFHVCGGGPAFAVDEWDRLPARVEPTTRDLLEMLERAGVRATFFIVGWIAERYPGLVELVRLAGHEIGSHGQHHRRVYEIGPDAFLMDLRASMKSLAAAGVPRVTLFRAPEWSINERSLWALDTLVQEGFRVDASMAPLKIVGMPTYPRFPHLRQTAAGAIVEVPPFVTDRFGQAVPTGWGWGLRMSSSKRVLREVDRLNRSGLPAVFTVHPWEIDPDPPKIRMSPRLHFAHYFKLQGFRERLRDVLSGTAFGCIGELAAAGPFT
jgi:polysaccharide deacetylase family protein (PEP-CTERM system associated)